MADADARAARKARILASQEKRLKYVSGQADSLKKSTEEEHEEKTLDDMLEELHPETSDEVKGLVMPTIRADPAQRRRDAALRKQKQQEKVQERLHGITPSVTDPVPSSTPDAVPSTTSPPNVYESKATTTTTAPQRNAAASSAELVKLTKAKQDLLFFRVEQWAVLLVLIVAAAVVGFYADIQDYALDPRLKDVDDLLAQGFTLASIKQQLERDNADLSFLDKRSLADTSTQLPVNTIPFLPSFIFDMFIPAVVNPPLLLFPILARLLLGGLFFGARSVLDVPSTGDHESDDSGWIMKLLLSQVPILRDGFRMVKKTGDDFCLFLMVLCITVAVRAVVAGV
ncbi:hypothetical protein DYB25_007648 [Aphanomyces astaci]|uniref:Transmembrane protein n=1 Tax=Aphanomyces astaci TaxID=112090 RepID=A0A397E1U1_APHAT|nr:hypothetical protein DYB25_007648 [Aphanomyces astaci]RHY46211.1 hypothetical protein DYB38_004048 [Aphanomyces astaci]RHY68574.1 hypothetical protein DYB34_004589 [Aphanomyces astaci]RHY74768.1 hypothetical protein DYB30_008703 [Aphanomyces astaci]RHZ41308.1 hypothetical protein DYB31_007670 [Aphanomyces astaci]